MAAAVEVPAGGTPPAYDKTDSEAAFLKETIETNRLMKNLEPSDREQLGKAFQKVSFAKGDFIIKQGDKVPGCHCHQQHTHSTTATSHAPLSCSPRSFCL